MFVLKLAVFFLVQSCHFVFSEDIIDFSSHAEPFQCESEQFLCHNTTTCLSKLFQCDGHYDCPENDDEFDCDLILCKESHYFKCKNGDCVSKSFTCDGTNDCSDGSDEENCYTSEKKSTSILDCRENEFQCLDGSCISNSYLCDFQFDCPDKSDESEYGCLKANITCDTPDFLCRNKHCIVKEWVCDGNDDCHDNSDEESCPTLTNIPVSECFADHELHKCNDERNCIHFRQLCDGKKDCFDGSDEGGNCTELCTLNLCHPGSSCTPTPTGPMCYCPMGTKKSSIDTCIDIDECLEYGICDQRCNNTLGSYSCYCDPGFQIQHDGRSCKMIDGEAILFYSSFDKVKSINLHSHMETTIAKDMKHVAGVASDGHQVYWSIIYEGEEVIMKANVDGTSREIIVSSGLGSPEDIAVDWLTKNIYFTDNKAQHIGVCENTGEYCAIIVIADIDRPRGITVVPSERIMFWSDWGKKAMIGTSGMDGSNARPFISDNIHWPNDITIDLTGGRLYWIDAKSRTIESVKIDASDRRMVLQNQIKHPFSITVFESTLFWSDWDSKEILSCNKFNGKQKEIIKKERGQIYGIHIYHPSMHEQTTTNPCENHPCSDICLLSPNSEGFTCVCPEEKSLQRNKRTCESKGMKPAVVFGQGQTLILVEHQALGRQSQQKYILKGVGTISALAYDVDKESIIISDVSSKQISYLNLATREITPILKGATGKVTAMAYDNYGYNLYWCDIERGVVEVMNLVNSARKTLLSPSSEIPLDIALVPKEGFMFVAFVHNQHIHIDRIRMDGSMEHRTHVIEDGLVGPHISLHYDEDLDRVFWTSSFSGHIESTDIEGLDRHSYADVSSPMCLATVSNDLFWTSYEPSINWGNKYNFEGFKNHPLNIDIEDWNEMDYLRVTAVKGSRHHIGPNPCDNSGCSDICLLAGKTKVCACPLGKILSSNGLTCEEMPQCASQKQFQCNDGRCISLNQVCNGHSDCIGGEDEDKSSCKPNNHLNCTDMEFACLNGERCIPKVSRCNGIFDCIDLSDEKCDKEAMKTCTDSDFQCDSGECISRRFLCDKINHCKDGSDEKQIHCPNCTASTEFRCKSGACIPKGWECDGAIDCTDESDEHAGCVRNKCKNNPNAFECRNSICIPKQLKCDGKDDCGDKSDEQNCPPHANLPDSIFGDCQWPNFKCTSDPKVCLPPSAKCNGTKECSSGEDEISCKCAAENFECVESKECLPYAWVCDGAPDCMDASDEEPKHCRSTSKLTSMSTSTIGAEALVPCSDYTCDNYQCVSFGQLCDKHVDCEDGSDENGRCSVPCDLDCNGGKCIQTPKGPICQCGDGFYQSTNKKSCEDINECAISSYCAQICTNTVGSYKCSCVEPDFMLKTDQTSCKAVGPPMEIYYIMNGELRKLVSSHLTILHTLPMSEVGGFDIDIKGGHIYWSSGEAGVVTQFDYKTLSRKKHITGLIRPHGISVDWIRGIVYIVESNYKIIACQMDRHACAVIYASPDLIHISTLSVDPINRYLFWSETNWLMADKPVGTLKRSDLSGNNVTTIAEGQISHVTSIAIDDIKQIIYWSDYSNKYIGMSEYDGSYRKTIVDTKISPLELVMFEDSLYLSQATQGSPFSKCYLYGNLEKVCEVLDVHVPNIVSHFTIAQPSRQRMGVNKCHNSSCSHLCLESSTGPICVCHDGNRINPLHQCEDIEKDSIFPKLVFENRTIESTTKNNAGAGSIFMSSFVVLIILCAVAAVYHFFIKNNVSNLVPKIHFRNPVHGNLYGRGRTGFDHIRTHEPNSILLPTSPVISKSTPNFYENFMDPKPSAPPSVQFKYANEMTVKHGEENFWSTRRNSESSTGTDYAEIEENPKRPLI